jgi:RNA polymerase sigma-70 factor (ECF subfamily)
MQDDHEIVARITGGDLNAFKLLVNRHERLVRAMAIRVVQRQEDVEDICQEVFLKVYKSLPGFKFESKLSTWIAQIAYSAALNHLRKNRRKTELSAELNAFDDFYKDTDNPEIIFMKKNTSEFIQREIAKLPLNYRTVLTLYHLNELSYQEIGEITGMIEGNIKSNLFRARKLLKDKLANYYK